MMTTPSHDLTRRSNGQFGPGNPGKPRGAKNRMPRRIAFSLMAHFMANEALFLERLSDFFFKDYMRLLGRLLTRPTDDDGPELPEHLDPAEKARIIANVRAALDRVEAGEADLDTIELALGGCGEAAPAPDKYGAGSAPDAAGDPAEPPDSEADDAGPKRFADMAAGPPRIADRPGSPPKPRTDRYGANSAPGLASVSAHRSAPEAATATPTQLADVAAVLAGIARQPAPPRPAADNYGANSARRPGPPEW
jgi:hypothetical protein